MNVHNITANKFIFRTCIHLSSAVYSVVKERHYLYVILHYAC